MRAETQILSGDVVSINMRILESSAVRDPGVAGAGAAARHLHPETVTLPLRPICSGRFACV